MNKMTSLVVFALMTTMSLQAQAQEPAESAAPTAETQSTWEAHPWAIDLHTSDRLGIMGLSLTRNFQENFALSLSGGTNAGFPSAAVMAITPRVQYVWGGFALGYGLGFSGDFNWYNEEFLCGFGGTCEATSADFVFSINNEIYFNWQSPGGRLRFGLHLGDFRPIAARNARRVDVDTGESNSASVSELTSAPVTALPYFIRTSALRNAYLSLTIGTAF